MDVKKVFVVGAGLMGGGITQVTAVAGYPVTMRDISQEALEKGLKNIEWSLSKFVEKGKIDQEVKRKALDNINTTTEMGSASEADLVIEAVFEDIEVKRVVFKELDGVCRPEAILATNTSAIPISEMAAATERPDKVVGTHFFSPVPMMRMCELIRGLSTSDETLETVENFAQSIGKETVVVRKDVAGFLLNRIALTSTLEAVRLLEAGVATPEDIDKGMRLGYGHAMGPLETADMTGVDVLFKAVSAIYDDTQDEKYWPPSLMRRMVIEGLWGRKTGKGFYDYSAEQKKSYWQL